MAVDYTRPLLLAALGDVVLALVLAVVAAMLLRRFMARLVERHREVALYLIEPPEGRMQRLHAYLKARESRKLNDPKAHALAFGAYVCVWCVMILLVLAPITVIVALIV
jgi:hypothetical protein